MHRDTPIGGDVDAGDGTTEALVLVVGDEPIHQRLAGKALQPGVERGANAQAAAIELILAEQALQLAPHFLGEVLGRIEPGAGLAWHDVEVFGLGRGRLFGRDVTVLLHAIEHPVAPVDGGLGIAERMVVGGRLGQRGEIGRFRQRQFVECLVEVVERRRRDAVGLAADRAEEDLIEIELEDLVLAEGRLDPQRQDRLLNLAVPGLVEGQKEVLGHLLGDGRGADQRAAAAFGAAQNIVARRADHAQKVDAAVIVEVLVLGGQEGLDQDWRDGFDRLEQPALTGIFGQQRAVRSVNARRHRRLIVLEDGVVRQFIGDLGEVDAGSRHARQSQKHAKAEEPAK